MEKDEAARINEPFWDQESKKGIGYTIPYLNLDPKVVREFALGKLDPPPKELRRFVVPFGDVEGKDVLCLGAGGGQQSAAYGVLGANVTVVDLSQRQLDADRRAAEHYGYPLRAIHSDMRDLSSLDDGSIDVVYATGLCYVREIRRVYEEVARVLRPGGSLRMDAGQPAIFVVEEIDGRYTLGVPYCETVYRRKDGAIEFRHYMDDVFNGLLEAGLSIQGVVDPGRTIKPDPTAPVGSWTHESAYVGGHFIILATKAG